MDNDIATRLIMTLDGQSDFQMSTIGILIAITKALPEPSRDKIAGSILELIEEHKEGLKDLQALHALLLKRSADGK